MQSTLGALPRVVYRLPHGYPPHRSAFRWLLHLIATLTLAPPRTHARTRVRATIIGVPSDPKQFAKWNPQQFDDEPNLKEFKRGTISYAGAGVNSRSCHLFIAFGPGQCQLAPHLFGSTREMQPPPFPPDGGGAAHQGPLESVASSTSATLC